jgi:NADH-quinone oxidoreductase subunit A
MDYLFILLGIFLTGLLVFGALGASRLIAPHHPGVIKNTPYECGEETIGVGRVQFHAGYYLFALLFLAFDVEAAFLYPWAVVMRKFGGAGLLEAGLFILVLVLGLAYAWRKGALEWE